MEPRDNPARKVPVKLGGESVKDTAILNHVLGDSGARCSGAAAEADADLPHRLIHCRVCQTSPYGDRWRVRPEIFFGPQSETPRGKRPRRGAGLSGTRSKPRGLCDSLMKARNLSPT